MLSREKDEGERQKAKGKRQKAKVNKELSIYLVKAAQPSTVTFAFCLLPFAFLLSSSNMRTYL